tara:strand:- start:634 stop:1233 length:600 start_codon:yes stop_codon:yes gene_type:complete
MTKFIADIPIIHNGIFKFQLDLKDDYLTKFKEHDFTLTTHKSKLNYISCDLNSLDKYKKLNDEIKNSVKFFIKNTLCMKSDFTIYKSWLTLTEPKGSSNSHNHSNSWISGVYYPEQNNDFKIRFYNDYANHFKTEVHKQNIYNSITYDITPEKNELILFFSNLRHKILENKSDKNRYSLSFNCLPKGTFGVGDSSCEFI